MSIVHRKSDAKSSEQPAIQSDNEVGDLLQSYQLILNLSDKIASTLLIRNNDWIIQVKSIRQHYLFTTDEGLMEMRTVARCAIEIGKRTEKNNSITAVFNIFYDPSDTSYKVSNEQNNSKTLSVSKDEKDIIPKIVAFLTK